MQFFGFITLCVLWLTSLFSGFPTPLLQESSYKIQYRISVANSNIKKLKEIIPIIQNEIKNDPQKAQDLCCTAMKFAMNIERCLMNSEEESYP